MAEGGPRQRYEGYDEARSGVAVEVRPPGGLLSVNGRDAVPFLQGVLTNDVAALDPGQMCYAAALTAQGRMVSDMHVLRRGGDVLLIVEPQLAAAVAARFNQSIFTEDANVGDLSSGVASIGLHGPDAHAAAASAAGDGRAEAVATALAQGSFAAFESDGGTLVVFGLAWLGVPGVRVVGPEAQVHAIRERLAGAGVPDMGSAAVDARRIEAGTPVFGVDMTEDTIPLEAGIEDRAISTTKGCYVGQEIVVRILHRGGGRVARRLVGLIATAPDALQPGSHVHAGGRDVGHVTSAAWSPDLGCDLALAMIHRDAFADGTAVVVGDPPGIPATVRQLPFRT